jgi:hypothetical protein
VQTTQPADSSRLSVTSGSCLGVCCPVAVHRRKCDLLQWGEWMTASVACASGLHQDGARPSVHGICPCLRTVHKTGEGSNSWCVLCMHMRRPEACCGVHGLCAWRQLAGCGNGGMRELGWRQRWWRRWDAQGMLLMMGSTVCRGLFAGAAADVVLHGRGLPPKCLQAPRSWGRWQAAAGKASLQHLLVRHIFPVASHHCLRA